MSLRVSFLITHLIVGYRKDLILSILLGVLLLMVSVSSLQSTVETQLGKKFLVYENSNLGFRMLYPSGWQLIVENPGRVIFSSPDNTLIRIIVDNISRHLDQSTQIVKNLTAHGYALNETKGLQGVASNIRDVEVTTGTAHIPSWRVDYFLPSHYVVDTIIVTNGKLFRISYVDVPSKVSQTLPVMEMMLNSFQIIK